MTIAYIQKNEFFYAEDIIKVLNSRVINVSAIGDTFKNNSPIITTSNNTYICTSLWENKLGGQQGLLEFARKVKSKTIIVVHEKCNEFKIEKHLGGNLIRFYFKEEPYEIKINENFQLQLLLSLIQPKDSMTAGDTNSYQLLKLSKKFLRQMSQCLLMVPLVQVRRYYQDLFIRIQEEVKNLLLE